MQRRRRMIILTWRILIRLRCVAVALLGLRIKLTYIYLIQRPTLDVASRQRSRSEMRSKMSDDFWVKERNNKLEEERVRIRSELENVKTTRQLFVDDFSSR